MQVKKEAVKKAIEAAAIEEFLTLGYDKSSLRRMVKAAGTTLGNFYNYFSDKESLFAAIVDEPYQMVTQFISHHNDHEAPQDTFDLSDVATIRHMLSSGIESLLPFLHKPLVILLTASQGTPYQAAREQVEGILVQHFQEHILRLNPLYQSPDIAPIYAKSLVDGLLHIVTLHEDKAIIKDLVTEYILFYAIGTTALLQVEDKQGRD